MHNRPAQVFFGQETQQWAWWLSCSHCSLLGLELGFHFPGEKASEGTEHGSFNAMEIYIWLILIFVTHARTAPHNHIPAFYISRALGYDLFCPCQ